MSNWDAEVTITKKLATDVDAWLDVAISSIVSIRKRDKVMALQDELREAVKLTDEHSAGLDSFLDRE